MSEYRDLRIAYTKTAEGASFDVTCVAGGRVLRGNFVMAPAEITPQNVEAGVRRLMAAWDVTEPQRKPTKAPLKV